jgi:hypothetical protein
MRPVRFVALSEDGQALVLADEVGRLLALPIDDRVSTVIRTDRAAGSPTLTLAGEGTTQLAPRDIQARIRAGESADDVARVAGVPVDRVLRYAGPVLQERAMLAQHARRTRLKSSDRGASLAEVVDTRLGQHGIDLEKISWDAYRRDDGTWRIIATWPSGKATATAQWELDKARQTVTPHDDMAQYLCADRPTPLLGQEAPAGPTRPEPGRGGHEPMRPPADAPRREPARPGRDPIRAGRDSLLASLERDRPAGAGIAGGTRSLEPAAATLAATEAPSRRAVPSAFDDDSDRPQEIPAVPSLAVLRPRRSTTGSGGETAAGDKPRKRAPSWDDVLFGSAPAAKDA